MAKHPACSNAIKRLFNIPVIHTNLNGYAEFLPPLQGAQRPQRGKGEICFYPQTPNRFQALSRPPLTTTGNTL